MVSLYISIFQNLYSLVIFHMDCLLSNTHFHTLGDTNLNTSMSKFVNIFFFFRSVGGCLKNHQVIRLYSRRKNILKL